MSGNRSPTPETGGAPPVSARALLLLLPLLACGKPRPAQAVASRAPAGARLPAAPAPTFASAFAPTRPNPEPAPGPAPAGMVWIPGGEFSMGAGDDSQAMADALPIHRVYVDGFWMDTTEVTNDAFARFVRETGYVTVAERQPRPEDLPGVADADLRPGSTVFVPPSGPVPLDTNLRWWRYVERASWRRPFGPNSAAKARARFPVVHVAYEDAEAYARWAGKRLPTEAEFEFAARGGLAGRRFAWGDELRPGGRVMANTFQGHFPDHDSGGDGWAGIAPVASYPPNRYGLFDVAGNVWEWCRDWYRPDAYVRRAVAGGVVRNPTGPETSDDPAEPGIPKRVQRGGSFLCSSEVCTRYLVGARGRGDISTGTNHLGFRCVRAPGQTRQAQASR
jgi:formylglycine-generating enzyme required for sulfatase activity